MLISTPATAIPATSKALISENPNSRR
ncbi:hypothetical protein BCEN4_1380043 [Burkholderia cenocepacia]|nr:hypothetical protein BCEN4_1380043 [Burkholderia cenocepacia]